MPRRVRGRSSCGRVPDAHRFEHDGLRAATADIDVLCVQEVFLSESERFFESLPHTSQGARDDNRTRWLPLSFGGSGLAIASRLPFSQRTLRAFAPPHIGTERFARKGMLHVRVEALGTRVDVITTHLQSGMGTRARAIRARQLRALREFVDEVALPGGVTVVCGDLNVDGLAASGRAEYAAIASGFHDFVDLGAESDWATFHPHPDVNVLAHRFYASEPAQRLDYVLLRSGDPNIELVDFSRLLDQPLTRHGHAHTHASDHFALRVRLRRRDSG